MVNELHCDRYCINITWMTAKHWKNVSLSNTSAKLSKMSTSQKNQWKEPTISEISWTSFENTSARAKYRCFYATHFRELVISRLSNISLNDSTNLELKRRRRLNSQSLSFKFHIKLSAQNSVNINCKQPLSNMASQIFSPSII